MEKMDSSSVNGSIGLAISTAHWLEGLFFNNMKINHKLKFGIAYNKKLYLQQGLNSFFLPFLFFFFKFRMPL